MVIILLRIISVLIFVMICTYLYVKWLKRDSLVSNQQDQIEKTTIIKKFMTDQASKLPKIKGYKKAKDKINDYNKEVK